MKMKKYSLSNLSEAPRNLRDLSESELKSYFVNGSKVVLAARSGGQTRLDSCNGSVSLPNHTIEANIQSVIDFEIERQNQARESAKAKIMDENCRRRDVMGTRI